MTTWFRCPASRGTPEIRAPFYFRGEAYVTTATSNHEAEAYRLVPVEQFQGDATTYRLKVTENTEDVDAGDHARNDPNGFYHGITVKHGSKTYVLCGPSKLFGPESATVDEAQTPQRDTEQRQRGAGNPRNRIGGRNE